MIYKQQKRLGWIAFSHNKPPKTSDGKKYLCTNFMGEMQVCTWDGIVQEWIYSANEMVSYQTRRESCQSAAFAAFELFNKRLPKSKQLSPEDCEELTELCIEKAEEYKDTVEYFDCVEWYMELPETPADVSIYAKDGDTVQAEIFEQELDLMAHIEEAIKNYSRSKAKILKQGDFDAP